MRGYPEGFQNTAQDAASAVITAGIGEGTFESRCGTDLTSNSCRTFLQDQIQSYVGQQLQRKDAAIQTSVLQTKNTFDSHLNVAGHLTRNQDLLDTKGFVDAYNKRLLNSTSYDNDLTRRQFEINEYHYHNKLDTLFFLQIFFIAVLIMAILIYFNRRGVITNTMMGLLIAALTILIIMVAVSRYFYNVRTRDRRLWHRRYFQSESNPRPDLVQTCSGPSSAPIINLNAIFDKEDIQCATETIDKLKQWNTQAENEARDQISGKALPSAIFSSSFTTPAICKSR